MSILAIWGQTLKIVRFVRSSNFFLLIYYNLFLQKPNTSMYLSSMCNVLLSHTSHTVVSRESHLLQATTHNTED